MDESELPAKGFYVHYKHDPKREKHNYMYEVVGVGRNTEENTLTVLYRPLYKSDWMPPADYQSRPLDMFVGNIEKDGKWKPRFSLVTDEKLIAELYTQRELLYGSL